MSIGLLSQTLLAGELPESVQKQSRKDAVESETWKKFDKSGQVKFLQVQNTAAASKAGTGAKLDGSIGERLIEIKVAMIPGHRNFGIKTNTLTNIEIKTSRRKKPSHRNCLRAVITWLSRYSIRFV